MTPFKLNQVLHLTIHATGEPNLFRLIWKCEREDHAWLIEIPNPKVEYCKGPFVVELSMLAQMKNHHEISTVELTPLPITNMTDAEIMARYPGKDGTCSAIQKRKKRWEWIKDLVEKNTLADIFECDLIPSWVNENSKQFGATRKQLYDAIHRYFAGGQNPNALLPNWCFSGAKGTQREQRRKIGRPDKEAAVDPNADRGYFLADEDKQKLRFAWKYFLPGKTVSDAYLEMLGVFYNCGYKVEHGQHVPILLPRRKRPTITQFIRWGTIDNPERAAWRVRLAPNEWVNDYKGMPGSAKDGIAAVGVQAFCDTTTNDAHLVSITSRLRPVGTLNRLMIHEAKSELILGLHCGFEPPSARTFLLAVANAASSKVDYYARFGLTITDNQAPAAAVKTYLGDNGEYRGTEVKQALKRFGATVEMAASGKARLKGPVEGLHHVMHSRLDETLDGATHGRPRRRGERNPVLDACMNYYEYMHELLKEVFYYNNEEIVEHLLDSEMRAANVTPTRIAIFHWLVETGYIKDFTPDVATLRAHLYAVLPAKLTPYGIRLLREDCGEKEVFVHGLRYMSDYLIKKGMLDQARRSGARKVTVRGIPEDLSKIWWVTDDGLIELECITDDPILVNRGTMQDCMAIHDDDKIRELQSQDQVEQRRSDIQVSREENLKAARDAKAAEIAALPKKPSKAKLSRGIDENRKAEIDLLSHSQTPSHRSITDDSVLEERSVRSIDIAVMPSEEEDPALRAIRQFLEQGGTV